MPKYHCILPMKEDEMVKSTNYSAKKPDENGHINYSDDENAVWRDLFEQQQPKTATYMADVFLDGQDKLNLSRNSVPQCQQLSKKLTALTGWRVEPVPALIGFKQFFDMLANKTFPAASFIRSRADFDYIEEPDIFHEIYGHTPLLTDVRFAQFSQAIGKAGQNCDKPTYAWLIRLYWFTIEFGLIKQNEDIKALGSGLASSPTELVHSIDAKDVIRKPFDVIDILRTPYRIDIHQPIYFVLESVEQLLDTAKRNLLADIKTAQNLGLHAPTYPSKTSLQKASNQ